jgi:hypothetical protein
MAARPCLNVSSAELLARIRAEYLEMPGLRLTAPQAQCLFFTLPDSARVHHEWWANKDPNDTPQPHSRSWILASRPATPNLQAQTAVCGRAHK